MTGSPAESSRAAQQRVEAVLLGGARKYTRDQVCAKAGVPIERATALWRALGFATVGDDAVVFTDSDAEALRMTDELMRAGIMEPELATASARMLGQHLSRLAEWQVHVLRDVLAANPELFADERQLGRFVERLVPDLERMQNYAWRRHLAAFAGRALAAPGEDLESRSEVVGFADMVGFTSLTRRSTEDELVTVVDRFDMMTAEVVAENHGRIVKMLGDEVLFVADSPRDGARIALLLLDRARADTELPDLRAGLAYGRVLSRFGDIYGSVVNIASRLTSVARPGTVLIDRELAIMLADSDEFVIRHRRPVSVRGYHRLRPSVLRRAGAEAPSLVDSVHQRAAELLGLGQENQEPEGMPSIALTPDPGRRRRGRRG
ncbi:adenylate/guanylate cyclase domain-containing protein [Actinokineospora sp.]|uniref:adenylate/guanylate cyclase domain-containing protein n=1 Tax=Actinokineospora sp. TaxID=1872133 RepID=UPI004037A05A